MTKAVAISRGYVSLVDDEDYEIAVKRRWHAVPVHNTCYARDSEKSIYLHQLLLEPPSGLEVDHINGNGLDNRRENLRVVTHAVNIMNTGMFSSNTSGYRGVIKYRGKWRAQFKYMGMNYSSSTFDTAEQAALFRDALARLAYPGERTYLNFPDVIDDPGTVASILKKALSPDVNRGKWLRLPGLRDILA